MWRTEMDKLHTNFLLENFDTIDGEEFIVGFKFKTNENNFFNIIFLWIRIENKKWIFND